MPRESYFPTGGAPISDTRATASCFCKAVILEVPTEGSDLTDAFICNCVDCRKLTSSMFASNFTAKDNSIKHLQGQDKLTTWAQHDTIDTGNTMTNYFCKICGTLMYRVSSGLPGHSILRIGTLDDFSLQETKLKPWREQFVKDRVEWFTGGVGIKQQLGNPFKDGENGPWTDDGRKKLDGY